MSITSVLSVIATIFGLLGIIGGAVAYLASIRQKTTVATLKDDNDALRGRVDTIDALERDCQVRLAKAETTVQVLTDTVTNAQAVADLLARVDVQHADLKTLAAEVKANFAQVLALLDQKAPA